jgi:activator of 2-hydroxyglutaryl-CoA dehydratase
MSTSAVAGIDVGTECVKAIVLAEDLRILGRAIVPTRGLFEDRAHEALTAALDEAGVARSDLIEVRATGFASARATDATTVAGVSACHATM